MKTGFKKPSNLSEKTRNPQVKKLKLPLLTGGSFCLFPDQIFEQVSKLRSLELMERYFGIKHSCKTYCSIAL
jgi:hypothetical protein